MQTVGGFEEGDKSARIDCKKSRIILRLLSGAEIWKLADFWGGNDTRVGEKAGRNCAALSIFSIWKRTSIISQTKFE